MADTLANYQIEARAYPRRIDGLGETAPDEVCELPHASERNRLRGLKPHLEHFMLCHSDWWVGRWLVVEQLP